MFSYHISCLRKNKNEDKEICLKCVVKVPKVCSEKLQWLLGLLFLPENIFLDKYKIFVINWSILKGTTCKNASSQIFFVMLYHSFIQTYHHDDLRKVRYVNKSNPLRYVTSGRKNPHKKKKLLLRCDPIVRVFFIKSINLTDTCYYWKIYLI